MCPMYLKYVKEDERFRLCKDCTKCKSSIDRHGQPLLDKNSYTEPGKPAADGKVAIRSTLKLCLTCYNKLFAQKRNLFPEELNALGWRLKSRSKPKNLSLEDRIDRLEEYVRSVCATLGTPFPLNDDVAEPGSTGKRRKRSPSPPVVKPEKFSPPQYSSPIHPGPASSPDYSPDAFASAMPSMAGVPGDFSSLLLEAQQSSSFGDLITGEYSLGDQLTSYPVHSQPLFPSAVSWECYSCGNKSSHAFSCSTCGAVRCDMRWKNEVREVTSVLADVCDIQARLFTYKDDPAQKEYYGVMAQEVLDKLTLSNLVVKGPDGFMQVRLGEFVPILLQCVKELNGRIDDKAVDAADSLSKMKRDFEAMETKLSSLELQLQGEQHTVYARGLLESTMTFSGDKEDILQGLADALKTKMDIADAIASAIQEAQSDSNIRIQKMESQLRDLERLMKLQQERKEYLEAELEYELSCVSSQTSEAPSTSPTDAHRKLSNMRSLSSQRLTSEEHKTLHAHAISSMAEAGSSESEPRQRRLSALRSTLDMDAVRELIRVRSGELSESSYQNEGKQPSASLEVWELIRACSGELSECANGKEGKQGSAVASAVAVLVRELTRLVRQGKFHNVQRYLQKDVPGDIRDLVLARACPVHVACSTGNYELIKAMVRDFNLNVDVEDPRTGLTPLHVCIGCSTNTSAMLDIVRFLLREGANINTPAPNGMTPLHIAVKQANLPVAKLLLRKGANPNVTQNSGRTPLLIAVEGNHLAILKLLLRYNASVDFSDYELAMPEWKIKATLNFHKKPVNENATSPSLGGFERAMSAIHKSRSGSYSPKKIKSKSRSKGKHGRHLSRKSLRS